jgi:hypothetical protein
MAIGGNLVCLGDLLCNRAEPSRIGPIRLGRGSAKESTKSSRLRRGIFVGITGPKKSVMGR